MAFTLDVYAHVIPGMQQQAAEQISTLVFGPSDDPGDHHSNPVSSVS